MLFSSKILQKSVIHSNFFLFEDERNGRDNRDNDKDNIMDNHILKDNS